MNRGVYHGGFARAISHIFKSGVNRLAILTNLCSDRQTVA